MGQELNDIRGPVVWCAVGRGELVATSDGLILSGSIVSMLHGRSRDHAVSDLHPSAPPSCYCGPAGYCRARNW